MDDTEKQLDNAMQERFAQLPKVVQNAITSAEVEEHLRQLATTHKLHLDQWTALENEVMLALLGFQPVEDLAKNISSEVGVDPAAAAALAGDISHIVFEPVRQELERQLDHPAAETKTTTGIEDARTQMLAGTDHVPTPSPATSVIPATPPPAAPTAKVERAAVSPAYSPQSASHERKTVAGDPYREQLS